MVITNDLTNNIINVTVSLQEKDGKYYAVMQYKDKNGKQQYKWKATKQKVEKGNKRNAQRIAEQIRQQFETELNTPESETADKSNMLFGNYMLEWLEKHRHFIELTTYGGYEHKVNKTANYFNDKEITLKELKGSHIQEFYDTLATTKQSNGKYLKVNTIKRYHATIHKALEDAIKLDLIDINPADKANPGKSEQYIAQPYNLQDLQQLLSVSKGELIELHILLAVHLGLRKEEVIGLKWDAIDFDSNTITIKHTVTNASKNGKRILVKKDKTKNDSSYRTLYMQNDIKQALLKKKTKQEENKQFFGNSYKNTENYVLVDDEGELIKPDRVTRRFSKLLKDNGMKHIRFHDLRHSCASLLLANNANMKQIQNYLGHSSYNTTANIYSHLDTNTNVVLATTIANALCMA